VQEGEAAVERLGGVDRYRVRVQIRSGHEIAGSGADEAGRTVVGGQRIDWEADWGAAPLIRAR
jgi:hypothetical protein